MNLKNISHLYFVGIGGIGMSALARFFYSKGNVVSGYDKTETELTSKLKEEGFEISFDDDISSLPNWALGAKDNLLVVYTPAIPSDSEILNYFKKNNFQILKRSEALAIVTENHFTIAVAGTHGKTSTTSYLAHILKSNNISSAAFLGGISSNYNTNYVSHNENQESIVVVEADEFDRSFLRLKPSISIITSCEADHLDIYGTYENLKQAYNDFANCTVEGGKLFIHESLKDQFKIRDDIEVRYYGTNTDIKAQNIKVENGAFHFDLKTFGLEQVRNGLPGNHNILNATAAISASLACSNLSDISMSISSFKGIKRRFETIVNNGSHIYIDDYAHHPTEITAAITTAKMLWPNDKITVVFQPHLFTRTRDFAIGFKEALSQADELVIMPIYPARELPISGVSSDMICPNKETKILNHNETLEFIAHNKPKVLLTLGAGNIDKLVKPLANLLNADSNE
ncbi:MAG: UDP-N-acetylmuramate--L-alanine ligase [Bacteroidia bacterium]